MFRLFLSLTFLLSFSVIHLATAQEGSSQAQQLYKSTSPAVYQIRVIDKSSGEKHTIGSGFRISADNLFATNYHVISDFVQKPEKYRVEYLHEDGQSGAVSVEAIDVIHDLAVLKASGETGFFVPLGSSRMNKGVNLYSLGNPHDLGMTVIEGTYNGLLDNTFYKKILFSGNLNAGMSGGPVFNHSGQVVGINVAIEGNGISYLVPVEYLKQLVQTMPDQKGKKWPEIIGSQLQDNQEKVLSKLIAKTPEKGDFAGLSVPKNISPAIKCWGESDDEKEQRLFALNTVYCNSEDRIYITPQFYTGAVNYTLYDVDGKSLSTMAFNRIYSELYGTQRSVGWGDEKMTTRFKCHEGFMRFGGKNWKTATCARRYNKYPSVYDVTLSAALLGTAKKGKVIEMALTGVSYDEGLKFIQHFLEQIGSGPIQEAAQ